MRSLSGFEMWDLPIYTSQYKHGITHPWLPDSLEFFNIFSLLAVPLQEKEMEEKDRNMVTLDSCLNYSPLTLQCPAFSTFFSLRRPPFMDL